MKLYCPPLQYCAIRASPTCPPNAHVKRIGRNRPRGSAIAVLATATAGRFANVVNCGILGNEDGLIIGLDADDLCAPFVGSRRNGVAIKVGSRRGHDLRDGEHVSRSGFKHDETVIVSTGIHEPEGKVL